jgi:hypothetical protein
MITNDRRNAGRWAALGMAVLIGAGGCGAAEVGTVGVPRPVGPDGKPLPSRPKGGYDEPAKAKSKSKAAAKTDAFGK